MEARHVIHSTSPTRPQAATHLLYSKDSDSAAMPTDKDQFPEGILSGGAVLDTLFFMVNKMAALFADFKHTV